MDENKRRGREIDFTKPPFGQPNEKEALAKICGLAEKWNKATKKIMITKYNSVHKFDNYDDANLFTWTIAHAGFYCIGGPEEGGVIYTNGKHKMLIYIG